MRTVPTLSIGAVAARTGCTVPTIRYYEEIGLLPPGLRTEAGRRVYAEPALQRLTFVRRCREFGFSIEEVRELVGLVDQRDAPCVDVRSIAAEHLGRVRTKLAELQALEASLASFVGGCDAECAGGVAADCSIFEDLSVRSAVEPRPTPGPCCSR